MEIPFKTFFKFGLMVLVIMPSCQTQRIKNSSENSISDTVILDPKSEKREFTRNLIIYYNPEMGNSQLMKAVADYGAEIIYEYNSLKGIAIKIPDGKSVVDAMTYFKKVKGVTSVHRDEIHHLNPPPKNLK